MQGKLEATHSELLMLSFLLVMEATANQWGFCFKQIFTEVVDIVVGWFMESTSMPDIRVRIGMVLAWRAEVLSRSGGLLHGRLDVGGQVGRRR